MLLLAENTLKQYNSIVNKIDIDNLDLSHFENIEKVVNSETKNINSRRVHFCAVLWYIRTNNINVDTERISDKIKKLSLESQKEQEKNKLSENQKKSYLSWSKILEVKKKVKKELEDTNFKSNPKYKFYIVLCLYSELPPRRLEFGNMKMYNRKPIYKKINEKENYLIIGEKAGYLLFNNYKTSKSYHTQKINLPSNLFKTLKKYVEHNRMTEGEELFSSSNNLGRHITKQMENYTNVPVTVNTLRHSYITNLVTNKMSVKKRKSIAQKMAHSVDLQLLYSKHKG